MSELVGRLLCIKALVSREELERQLAAEREREALALAEGTAVLKKAFVLLGGDEKSPIKIADLKLHVSCEATSDDIATLNAQRVKAPTLSTYVLDWKVQDVVQWLTFEMELPQYLGAIQQNAINGKLLLTLTESELESELGITATLHKRKMMQQITEWQEKFQYPPAAETRAPEKKKARSARPAAALSTTMETPAFIKREELLYDVRQRVKAAEAPRLPKTIGQTRVFPAVTTVLRAKESAEKHDEEPTRDEDKSESFQDAMADIFEAVHPDSPDRLPSAANETDPRGAFKMPTIQIGQITNTDELYEIVRQRVHQLSGHLLPLSKENEETHSDFGDADEDGESGEKQESEEISGLRLVFHAFTQGRSERISRLRLQEGLPSLLAIDVSWHQFDLLFRRLDVDGDSELCWDEFRHVFERRHISFDQEDLLFLQDALVNFVIDRLEGQQWTLVDLFKAFDRDGGGNVTIAEFATLVRFLFTAQDKLQATSHRRTAMKKRHVYLLMSCLDVSADRRISQQEFMRFFFIVWSNKLMEVQEQLVEMETARGQQSLPASRWQDAIEHLTQQKRRLRRALRTNFSRPFRDAMRCLDVSVPGPFTGLLRRLDLAAASPSSDTAPEPESAPSLKVWQVLKGETSSSRRAGPPAISQLRARDREASLEASRRRVQKGKNEVLRTRLTRQREPARSGAELRVPAAQLSLDGTQQLKRDHRQ
ncbi:hypothetical protein P43SY_004295 [Pythium insidiosum]|uniref:Calmodulin n=1 Tax=Pythium insidiosum TaxID=114742 RepID=A0AAD5QCA8_PYTIN|nr:hypothetical protein P43SY_004295 [Pythium insidiosum]